MKQQPTTSIGLIQIILQIASNYGIDPTTIQNKAGFSSSQLKNIDERVSASQYATVWQEVIEQSGDDNFGLHFGEQIGGHGGGHLLFYVISNCPDLGTALERLCRYHCLLSDEGQPQLDIQEDFAYLNITGFSLSPTWARHASEALLCSIMNFIRHATGNSAVTPAQVRFRHPQPEDTKDHQRVFGAPLFFEQAENQLVLDNKILQLPLLFANRELLAALEKHARKLLERLYEPDTLAERVVQLLGKMLQGETPTVDQVARKLAMSTRSLQAKLKQEGASYTQTLDQVRKEIAIDYLGQPDVAMIDIAFLLGFSEQSAFNHAFKRWTGKSPHQYRKRG